MFILLFHLSDTSPSNISYRSKITIFITYVNKYLVIHQGYISKKGEVN